MDEGRQLTEEDIFLLSVLKVFSECVDVYEDVGSDSVNLYPAE